ncbi:NAD-dependent epimerase/dehydratase family protein [Celeribacter halophilus]|uniref:NAD-dependent epimerase/dehydratase family protein n=1 Tax=Celeribacter halophilus TaxID=576117 RepID=UPI003A93175C
MPRPYIAFLGASGRIGRLLRKAERIDGDANAQIIWQFRSHLPDGTKGFLWSDFTDQRPLIAAQSKTPFAAILVFTGPSQPTRKDDAEVMQAHVSLVDQAITAAALAGVPRVLVASSSAVYGAGIGRAFREEDVLAPINAYGAAKAEMEDLTARRASAEGLEICALRIGNVAGADMLLGNASARTEDDPPLDLDIFPDGARPRRSYIGPQTLLKTLTALSLSPRPLPARLNLAATKPVEMNALLDAAQIPWRGRPQSDLAHQNITLDCSALAALCTGVDLETTARSIVAEWTTCLEQT